MDDGVDFELGPKVIIRPDWTDQHEFIPSEDDPEVCGYTEEPLVCGWPEESENHYIPSN